jgi:TRAP-type mannitol/chloroaromatic compound transport system substrate-binding protein
LNLGVFVVLMTGFITFSALSASAQDAPGGKKYKWRGICLHPQGHAGGDSFVDFCDRVRKMSNGRLDITPHLGGTLVPPKEGLDALKNGVVEVGVLYGGYNLGKMPEATLECGLIGNMESYEEEHAFWYYDGGGNKFMRESYAPFKVHFLGISLGGPIGLLSKKPIRKIADFKGLKVRTAGTNASLMEVLGAKTINIPVTEVYTALQLGTADAATYSDLSSYVAVGWHEVAKYAYPGFFKFHGNTNICVNQSAWNSLPDDLKAIADNASEISCFLHEHYEVARNMGARQTMEKAGCEIVKLPAADLAKIEQLKQEVWTKEAGKTARTAQAIKMYREYMLKRGYPKTW